MTRSFGVVVARAMAWLFPSVPAADRARVQVATTTQHPKTPAHGSTGEVGPWAGRTPEGEGSTTTPRAEVEADVAAETPRPPVPALVDTWRFR